MSFKEAINKEIIKGNLTQTQRFIIFFHLGLNSTLSVIYFGKNVICKCMGIKMRNKPLIANSNAINKRNVLLKPNKKIRLLRKNKIILGLFRSPLFKHI